MGSVFSDLTDVLAQLLNESGFQAETAEITAKIIIAAISVAIFLACAWVVFRLLKLVLPRALFAIARETKNAWDDELCKTKFPLRVTHLIISLLCLRLHPYFFSGSPETEKIVAIAMNLYFVVALTGTAFSIIDSFRIFGTSGDKKGTPIKGFFQAIKLAFGLGAAIWILSILSDKSPMYFLSGLGALTAVLLLVFRDALLGFTAGIMISANDTVKVGDWLELDGKTDGTVEDISLTTVKIRNWDNTISAIPAYSLISEHFKNWRGMQDSGGRRIKRAINIDLETIHFATEAELCHWQKIKILQPYLERKFKEIRGDNGGGNGGGNNGGGDGGEKIPATTNPRDGTMANSRNLTNIGTFRAYCVEYLRQNREIHKGMTLIVRQLNPGETGLPLEIYAFSKDTRWENYENIQSDIFDHLLAILPEFNLRAFQNPTGKNFETLARNKGK